jgi:hypothetical protein
MLFININGCVHRLMQRPGLRSHILKKVVRFVFLFVRSRKRGDELVNKSSFDSVASWCIKLIKHLSWRWWAPSFLHPWSWSVSSIDFVCARAILCRHAPMNSLPSSLIISHGLDLKNLVLLCLVYVYPSIHLTAFTPSPSWGLSMKHACT